jgi:hypothetical protein
MNLGTDGGALEFHYDTRNSELEKELGKYNINIKNEKGEYLPFTEIILDIKDKWDKMTENDQNYLCSILTM